MSKKVFKSKSFTGLSYEVIEEKWIDDDIYVIIFQDMKDGFGDTFHLEVEYHKDVDRVTYVKVDEYAVIDARSYMTSGILKEIEEYILRKAGKIKSTILTPTINLELKVDCNIGTTIGELHEWLKNTQIDIEMPSSDKFSLLSFEAIV